MKISIIMHGISGSGKSTRSKELIEEYNNKVDNLTYSIHSTDSLFIENGIYNFRPEKLPEYHSINYKNFVESINNNTMIVIVDNTNIFPEHWKPYEEAAGKRSLRPLSTMIHFRQFLDLTSHILSRLKFVNSRGVD